MKLHAFLVLLTGLLSSTRAFFVPFTMISSSVGSRLNPAAIGAGCTATHRGRRGAAGLTMKRKGKPNMDISQRGGYNQMMQQNTQFQDQKKAMESGLPAFQIYVRTKMNNMWYPCGLMMGDDKAKATVDAMMGGLLSGVSKYSLEKGVATSVLSRKKDLIRQVEEAYPQLKKKDLTFGFKVIYRDLEDKMGKQEVTEIEKDMTLGPWDAFKKNMGW